MFRSILSTISPYLKRGRTQNTQHVTRSTRHVSMLWGRDSRYACVTRIVLRNTKKGHIMLHYASV